MGQDNCMRVTTAVVKQTVHRAVSVVRREDLNNFYNCTI